VNHYERLKVSQDAPAEVIRAAYRALAGKLHPDRQGGDAGPDDVLHTQMAALNTAYEILIDPKLRQDYDATLLSSVRRRSRVDDMAGSSEVDSSDDEARQGPSTRVDMDWLTPKSAQPQGMWPPSPRLLALGGTLGAVVLLAGASWVWQLMGQNQMERALSDQYATHPSKPAEVQARVDAMPSSSGMAQRVDEPPLAQPNAEQAARAAAAGKPRRPSVQELARMSDEELLKVLPTLDAEGPESSATTRVATSSSGKGNAHHPLDGKPLSLRTDQQLIDPLAPEPDAKPVRRP
jgi:hypothetical protein